MAALQQARDAAGELWLALGFDVPNPNNGAAAAMLETIAQAFLGERTAIEAEVAEALRPFAEACAHLHPSHRDDGETLDGLKVGDFRRAAAVLAKLDDPQ